MNRKALVSLLALTLACSDSDQGPPVDPGSIQIAVTPAAVTIAAGTNGSVNVTLTRAGGFTGDVVLSATGVPPFVTIGAVTVPAGATSATLNIVVATGVAVGTHTATITATGQSVAQATATVQITVPPPPAFAVSVAAGGISIATGSASTVDVALQRTNYTGPINLSLLNPPVGVTATFTPASATGTNSILTLVVSPTASQGVIPLIIRGSAPGMADRTVAFDLTIRAPTAANVVEYQFCDPSSAPVFVAYQDGNSAWTAALGSPLHDHVRYAFDITSGHGAVFIVFKTSVDEAAMRHRLAQRRPSVASRMQASARVSMVDVYETYVLYGTTNELVQDGLEMCEATRPTKTVDVPIAGVPVGSFAFVTLTGATRIFDPATDANPVTLNDVLAIPGVPTTLVAARTTPTITPDRIILQRNVNVADGGTLPVVDFNSAAALMPAAANVAVSGRENDNLETFVDLVIGGRQHGLWSELASSTASVRPWAGLRPDDMTSSDFHALIVFASPQSNNGDFRVTQKFVDFVADETLALGSVATLPAITQVALGTYPRLRFQGIIPADYDRGIAFTVAPDSGNGNAFYVVATTGYLRATGNAFAYNVTIPDLTTLPGFALASGLAPGDNIVAVDMWGFNGPGGINPLPVRGGTFKAAVRNTTFTIQ